MQEGAAHKMRPPLPVSRRRRRVRPHPIGAREAPRDEAGIAPGARVSALLFDRRAPTRSIRSNGSCAMRSSAAKRARSSSSSARSRCPKPWSQQATNIVVSKYFRGHVGSPERERSVKQLIGRVVDTITEWARKQQYFASDDALDGVQRRSQASARRAEGGVQQPRVVQLRVRDRRRSARRASSTRSTTRWSRS